MTNIGTHSNMSFEQAKEMVSDLRGICEDQKILPSDIIEAHERDDYAEALRVVLEYLP